MKVSTLPFAPLAQTMSSSSAPSAGLVVCEKSVHWARAWRRECSPGAALFVAATIDDAWQQLEVWPHGALAIELRPQNAPQTIELLARIELQLPHVLCVAHLSPSLAAWELLLREAGAMEIVYSARRLPPAATLVERHLARAPRPSLSLVDRLWQRVPWSAGVPSLES
jgi:hypothetical protein